ncbi:hypothetical protein SUDANB95_08008 (plasmid) [Actinosynnema sp. ALI-1.44]
MTHRSREDAGLVSRIAQMLLGTGLMGVGVALVMTSRLGMVPLDVLHAAVASRSGWTFGWGVIATQAAVLALWVPLRIRPGPASVAGVVVPGLTCNALLAVLPHTTALPVRVAELVGGGLVFAAGVACYLGADLGAIPRDGVIMHLHRRHGHSLAAVRLTMDVACLITGWLLLGPVAAVEQGAVGAGSVLLALGLGPVIARLLPLCDRSRRPAHPQHAESAPGRRMPVVVPLQRDGRSVPQTRRRGLHQAGRRR